jgi:hypothetical protein
VAVRSLSETGRDEATVPKTGTDGQVDAATAWHHALLIAWSLRQRGQVRVSLAVDPGGDLATAEPDSLRQRLVHSGAWIVLGRRRHLKIAATWSWVDELAAEFTRVMTTPAPT